MTINTEMFQKVYDQITQHPETHYQGTWENGYGGYDDDECGTTRCVAGWAVAFAKGWENESILGRCGLGVMLPDGSGRHMSPVGAVAADILGLDLTEAYELFYDTNNAEAVEACLRYANKGDEA